MKALEQASVEQNKRGLAKLISYPVNEVMNERQTSSETTLNAAKPTYLPTAI